MSIYLFFSEWAQYSLFHATRAQNIYWLLLCLTPVCRLVRESEMRQAQPALLVTV
jgi:hypothetical protein